jgi:hypothetical protein
MKRAIFVFIATASVLAFAQEVSHITVKSAEVNSGVVIITAVEGKTSLELQCNKGMMGCKTLESGTYVIVHLPKNHGMYDCNNVEIFPSGSDPASAERLGAYCLVGK